MKPPVKSRMIAIGVLCAVLGAAVAGGAAHAITDTVFKYTTPKTGYFSVDAFGFAPINNASAGGYVINISGITSSAGNCFSTSVHVPNGAKLTALALWYTHDTDIRLYRHKVSDGTPAAIVSTTFSDSSGERKVGNVNITDAALQTIDNRAYSYSLVLCLSTSGVFHDARITYTYTNAGD